MDFTIVSKMNLLNLSVVNSRKLAIPSFGGELDKRAAKNLAMGHITK